MNEKLIFKLKKYWLGDKYGLVRPRSVVLKLTTKCNLSCKYCYVPNKHAKELNTAVVEQLFDQLMENNDNNVECVFHGGEPLLKFNLIKNIVDIISKKKYANQVRFSIQTNAVLLNHNVVKYAKENGISIGISLDGNQKINDLNRKNLSGEGSYKQIVNAIKEMQSNNMRFSVLSVVTEETLPYLLDTIDEFVRLGIEHVDIKPFFKLNDAEGALMEDSFSNSMLNLLDHIINKSLYKQITVRDFKVFSSIILERNDNVDSRNEISMCDMLNCGAGVNHITVDTNGDVYACDRLYLQEHFVMGNLMEQSLADILDSKVSALFKSRKISADPKCSVCEVNRYCFKGCPATNYLGNNHEFENFCQNPVVFCSYYKKLIKKLLVLYDTDKKLLYSLRGMYND